MEEIFRENSAKRGRNVYEQNPSSKPATLMIGSWHRIRVYLTEQKVINSSYIHVKQARDLLGYINPKVIIFPDGDPNLSGMAMSEFGEENIEFRT
jgi:hypothetical protein